MQMLCGGLLTSLLLINTFASGRIPGVKSIKQCYKYYDIQFSLREIDSYQPLTEEDFNKVLEQEGIEEDPTFSLGAVGGVNARPMEYPFMAALGYGEDTDKEYWCGGSLVSEQFVVTAAHCKYSSSGPAKYVRLGDLNLTNPDDDEGVQDYTILEFHVHPNYTYPLQYNDIGLIKLDRLAIFTDFVKPVCLEYERSSLKYALMYAAGWGALGYGLERSDYLQKIILRHYILKVCRKTYVKEARLPGGIFDDGQICAGTIQNITDTCEGDSGGPLVYLSNENGPPVYLLSGITSFGVPCGIAPLPAIYTRVSFYIPWIEEIIWPEASP